VASQAAVYVHAIAMLHDRQLTLAAELADQPEDAALRDEQAGLNRSLRLFRSRLRRTDEATAVEAPRR
jgi:hypothetical protein